jgi:hypothetical protein
MVESISQSEHYEEFEKKNNRNLNMLTDNVFLIYMMNHTFRIEISEDKA